MGPVRAAPPQHRDPRDQRSSYAAGGHRQDRPVRHLPGRRLRPPTGGPHRRHTARGGRPQGDVETRVRLCRRLGRLGGERRCQRGRFLPVVRRAADARRHDRARHVGRALRSTAREPLPRRTRRCAVDGRRRGRPRRRPWRPGAARHPDPQHPGLRADGGRRPRPRRDRALVPALLEQRRRPRREPRLAGRGVRQRRPRRHARHGIPRVASTRPRPRAPAVRPGRGHRAVHVGPRLPAARPPAGGGRRADGPATSHARGGRDPRVDEPEPPGRHPPQPHGTRAARGRRDLPRRLQPSVADRGTTCRGCGR